LSGVGLAALKSKQANLARRDGVPTIAAIHKDRLDSMPADNYLQPPKRHPCHLKFLRAGILQTAPINVNTIPYRYRHYKIPCPIGQQELSHKNLSGNAL